MCSVKDELWRRHSSRWSLSLLFSPQDYFFLHPFVQFCCFRHKSGGPAWLFSGHQVVSTSSLNAFVLHCGTHCHGVLKNLTVPTAPCLCGSNVHIYAVNIYIKIYRDIWGDALPALRTSDDAAVGGAFCYWPLLGLLPVSVSVDTFFFWLRPHPSASGQSDAVRLDSLKDNGRRLNLCGAFRCRRTQITQSHYFCVLLSWWKAGLPANQCITMASGWASLTWGSWTRLKRIGLDRTTFWMPALNVRPAVCCSFVLLFVCWRLVWLGITWHRHHVLLKDIPVFVMDGTQTLSQFDTFSSLSLNCLAERL